jgi:hypothetical protein
MLSGLSVGAKISYLSALCHRRSLGPLMRARSFGMTPSNEYSIKFKFSHYLADMLLDRNLPNGALCAVLFRRPLCRDPRRSYGDTNSSRRQGPQFWRKY